MHCEFCENEIYWVFYKWKVPKEVYVRFACIKHEGWVSRLVRLDSSDTKNACIRAPIEEYTVEERELLFR